MHTRTVCTFPSGWACLCPVRCVVCTKSFPPKIPTNFTNDEVELTVASDLHRSPSSWVLWKFLWFVIIHDKSCLRPGEHGTRLGIPAAQLGGLCSLPSQESHGTMPTAYESVFLLLLPSPFPKKRGNEELSRLSLHPGKPTRNSDTNTHTHAPLGGEEEETSRHTGSSRFCASYAFTNQIVAYRTKAPKGLLGFGCRTPIVVRFADLLQFYRHRSCFVRGGVRLDKEAIRSPDTRKSS